MYIHLSAVECILTVKAHSLKVINSTNKRIDSEREPERVELMVNINVFTGHAQILRPRLPDMTFMPHD